MGDFASGILSVPGHAWGNRDFWPESNWITACFEVE
jgi:hypothetical protein